jgi:hypothetical protein
VRTHYAGSSPPPLSPRIHSEKEKRHHSRRKSGREFVVVTEKKPSSRPAPLPHRSTPQSVTKGGRGWSSSGRSSSRHRSERERDRDRDRERDEDRSGRDSGESFPQYWYVKTHLFSMQLGEIGTRSWRHPQEPQNPRTQERTPHCGVQILECRLTNSTA